MATQTTPATSPAGTARILAFRGECWSCDDGTNRMCLGCQMYHCRICGCACPFRYWTQHLITHVIPNALQPDTAACGELPSDNRGGQFSDAPPRSAHLCEGCFGRRRLPQGEGWGHDEAVAELLLPEETIIGHRGPRPTKLRRNRFQSADNIVGEVQFRTSACPTPLPILRQDASSLLPNCQQRLARLTSSVRTASSDIGASLAIAESTRGAVASDAAALAHARIAQLAELVMAQVAERRAIASYQAVLQ